MAVVVVRLVFKNPYHQDTTIKLKVQGTVKACDSGGDCVTVVETLWLLPLGQIRLAAVDRMRVRGTVIIIQFIYHI